MARTKPRKTAKTTKRKVPRAKPMRRASAPKKARKGKRGTYGGNSVSLSYDSDSDTFVAITSEDNSTANITWYPESVELIDPDGHSAGFMDQDPSNLDRWTRTVVEPEPGKDLSQINFLLHRGGWGRAAPNVSPL